MFLCNSHHTQDFAQKYFTRLHALESHFKKDDFSQITPKKHVRCYERQRQAAVGCRQVLGKEIAGCLGTSGIVKTSYPRNQDLLP